MSSYVKSTIPEFMSDARRLLILALTAGMALFSQSASAFEWAKGRSYPMVCKGGAPMMISLTSNYISVNFKRARKGSTRKKPGPGQCAWLNRGMSLREPNTLFWNGPRSRSKSIQIRMDWNGKVHQIRYLTGRLRPTSMRGLEYVRKSIMGRKIFYLQVSNRKCGPRKRCMVITRFGP